MVGNQRRGKTSTSQGTLDVRRTERILDNVESFLQELPEK
jgi:hypothetical protein